VAFPVAAPAAGQGPPGPDVPHQGGISPV